MKLTKYQVRWEYRDALEGDDPTVHPVQSEFFISVTNEAAFAAAAQKAVQVQDAVNTLNGTNISVTNIRVVEMTEQVVAWTQ